MAAQELQPVHLRHLDVEEDDVGFFLARQVEPLLGAGGRGALVPFVLEDHPQRLADVFFVVDDQDPGLHGGEF